MHAEDEAATASVLQDTRSSVPCRFFLKAACLKGAQCPFAHSVAAEEKKKSGSVETGAAVEPDDGPGRDEESWRRELSGAVVDFGDGAAVTKVSFASDFSAVRLRGLPVDVTALSVVALLASHGMAVSEACVRIIPPPADDPDHRMADVRVEDTQFATRLCAVPAMKAFSAVPASSSVAPLTPTTTGLRRVDSKKVHVSWHKPTKTAWLNFGNGDIAGTVAERFQKGIYTVDGQRVQAKSSFSDSERSGRRRPFCGRNPLAWTVTLSDVPGSATAAHITRQIPAGQYPRHVELGRSVGGGTDLAVASASVHSLLSQAGPLEWWEESTGLLAAGKRHKAKARFLHEADAARAVDMLNNRPLPFNRLDRLTVQLVHTARLKAAAGVYDAAAGTILGHVHDWRARHVQYTAYPAVQGFCVLKVEGAVRQDVAGAKAVLETILAGETVVHSDADDTPLWSPAFADGGRRGMHRELVELEAQLGVAVLCDRRRSELRVVGTPQRQKKAQTALAALVRTLPSAATAVETCAIPLDGEQLTWAFRGGYKAIVDAVGPDKARLDIVSTPKRILVSGEDEYQTVMDTLFGRQGQAVPDGAPVTTCAVCWNEAENAVQMPCQHIYCSGCFEDLCHAGASTGTETGIRCVGEAATCNVRLPLAVLQAHLPSTALEDVLETAFTAHVAHHPHELRHCPTADCGQIYRAAMTATSTTAAAALFTCPACLAPVCRSCHVVHEGISCAEHRDRASGGYVALQLAKKDLGIKDCPGCGTLIEKSDGCNHMTCKACSTHICWVCLETFRNSELVYSHLNRVHGGIMDAHYGDV